MSSSKKISISIVNFQSKDFLEKCLASIFRNIINYKAEIVVINNDKEENLEELLLKFPEIKIINQKKNVGFGTGHNIGAKEAQGEILLFLNPDTEILEDISPVINLFENENIGVVGLKLKKENGEIQEWSAGKETSLWRLIKNNIGFSASRKIWLSSKPIKADWVSGAAFFIRKDLFNKLGGFDENFFMYYEDEDLCKRVRESGRKILYYPLISIKHLGGKSFKKEKKQKQYFYSSQDYYFQKHLGSWQAIALKVLRKIFLH
jgi:hypothetical protein